MLFLTEKGTGENLSSKSYGAFHYIFLLQAKKIVKLFSQNDILADIYEENDLFRNSSKHKF